MKAQYQRLKHIIAVAFFTFEVDSFVDELLNIGKVDGHTIGVEIQGSCQGKELVGVVGFTVLAQVCFGEVLELSYNPA
jgi:hypothetical protein